VRSFILVTLLLLSSCAGYNFNYQSNPFSLYGIKRLYVPVFVNKTVLPGVSSKFTKEFILLLSKFSDLKIIRSEGGLSDGVLVGIVESDDYRRKVLRPVGSTFTTGELEDSLGNRRPFYLPSDTQITLTLRLILIKKGTGELVELARSDLAPHLTPQGRIIFNETLALSNKFKRSVGGNLGPDSEGTVNFTKNLKTEKDAVSAMAQSAANNFEGIILNVF